MNRHSCDLWPNSCTNWVDKTYVPHKKSDLAGKANPELVAQIPTVQHYYQGVNHNESNVPAGSGQISHQMEDPLMVR